MTQVKIDPKTLFENFKTYCIKNGIDYKEEVNVDFTNYLLDTYGKMASINFNPSQCVYIISFERYEAVIIENRFDVTDIIEKHNEFIPFGWRLRLCHYPWVKTLNDYNLLLTSKDFWEKRKGDKVLIFQHDSGLLREGIEEFLEYDFIGAPLYHIDFPAMNGGLSLRSREAMIKCIDHRPWTPDQGNEDIYFCNILKEIGGKLPTKEVAQKFSVETIFGLGSLGYHAIDKWHSEEQVNQILNQYK